MRKIGFIKMETMISLKNDVVVLIGGHTEVHEMLVVQAL